MKLVWEGQEQVEQEGHHQVVEALLLYGKGKASVGVPKILIEYSLVGGGPPALADLSLGIPPAKRPPRPGGPEAGAGGAGAAAPPPPPPPGTGGALPRLFPDLPPPPPTGAPAPATVDRSFVCVSAVGEEGEAKVHQSTSLVLTFKSLSSLDGLLQAAVHGE